MELELKQWRRNRQKESEHDQQQHSGKIPKLALELVHQQKSETDGSSSFSLPLFVPEQPPATTKYIPNIGMWRGCFSMAQWEELELQAQIMKYIMAGAEVPHELVQPIKKSLLLGSPYLFRHPLPLHNHSPLLQSGYWGRAAMDPEPGRCRRTDGKKWRCSRDVVAGQKYCERHVHRGRNRSRKPVEITTSSNTTITPAGGGAGGAVGGAGCGNLSSSATHVAAQPFGTVASGQCCSDTKSSCQPQNDVGVSVAGSSKPEGHILRHFFDDWPRSVQEAATDNGRTNAAQMNSTTSLSISLLGNSSSDVSLKLSTGSEDEEGVRNDEKVEHDEQGQLGWSVSGWGTNQMVGSMGGPLAEALRSSNSNSSPTSVLHQVHPGSASQTTGFVST